MYRPQLHFTPKTNFMNDPNGLVYNAETKEYNLFFQYCNTPKEDQNQKYWGHAVSKDLLNWEELEVAIGPDPLGAIWSGCAVIDSNNTSGFFDDTTPPEARIVAIFTYAGGEDKSLGFQKQGIAYSKDNGRTFTKYEKNPVITAVVDGVSRFESRDPKVFWFPDESYENGGIWIMMIAGMWAFIFISHDLKNWRFSSQPKLLDGVAPLESECPDIFQMAVDGDEKNKKWIFCGSGRFFVVGNLVKKDQETFEFILETNPIGDMHGSDEMYAAQTFYNEPKGRHIGIYWLIDSSSKQLSEDGKVWDGAQSIPLEYKLVSRGNSYKILLTPVDEILSFRSELLCNISNYEVSENVKLQQINNIKGVLLDIEGVFTPRTMNEKLEFGFKVRKGGNEETIIKCSCADSQVIINKDNSGKAVKGIISKKISKQNDGSIKLRIIIDNSVVTICVNDGEATIDTFIFSSPSSDGIEFFTNNGGVLINELNVYKLDLTHCCGR